MCEFDNKKVNVSHLWLWHISYGFTWLITEIDQMVITFQSYGSFPVSYTHLENARSRSRDSIEWYSVLKADESFKSKDKEEGKEEEMYIFFKTKSSLIEVVLTFLISYTFR